MDTRSSHLVAFLSGVALCGLLTVSLAVTVPDLRGTAHFFFADDGMPGENNAKLEIVEVGFGATKSWKITAKCPTATTMFPGPTAGVPAALTAGSSVSSPVAMVSGTCSNTFDDDNDGPADDADPNCSTPSVDMQLRQTTNNMNGACSPNGPDTDADGLDANNDIDCRYHPEWNTEVAPTMGSSVSSPTGATTSAPTGGGLFKWFGM